MKSNSHKIFDSRSLQSEKERLEMKCTMLEHDVLNHVNGARENYALRFIKPALPFDHEKNEMVFAGMEWFNFKIMKWIFKKEQEHPPIQKEIALAALRITELISIRWIVKNWIHKKK